MIASLLLTALVQSGPDPAAALRPLPRPCPADSEDHARIGAGGDAR